MEQIVNTEEYERSEMDDSGEISFFEMTNVTLEPVDGETDSFVQRTEATSTSEVSEALIIEDISDSSSAFLSQDAEPSTSEIADDYESQDMQYYSRVCPLKQYLL